MVRGRSAAGWVFCLRRTTVDPMIPGLLKCVDELRLGQLLFVWRPTHFTRFRDRAAADQPRVGDGAVGRAEGAGGDQCRVGGEEAGFGAATWEVDTNTPRAIGRSKAAPSLRTSAGARL